MFSLLLFSCQNEKNTKIIQPATSQNDAIKEWENLRFGAFIHFNDNTSVGLEFSKNTDPGIFNPENLDFDLMMSCFKEAGIKYAVLTTRHTSGFCLWDSEFTKFDVASSPYKKDIVEEFVRSCKKYDIKPCLYYCLWGGKWKPQDWNNTIAGEVEQKPTKEIILGQLNELSSNYGDIYTFWLDMHTWCDSTLSVSEIYSFIKQKRPETFVHFNQHVQDGTKLRYFPTDIVNGEERLPPVTGHNPHRIIDSVKYYLPFEYEITSQKNLSKSLGNGLMKGSCWFTYTNSEFYPVDSLFHYIKQSYARGGSNVLLSTAPDKTGIYRQADCDSLKRLGTLIWDL